MFTLCAALTIFGFYIVYNTSSRALLQSHPLVIKQVKANVTAAKVVGVLNIVAALMVSIIYTGLGSGIFYFTIVLMASGSCIVILHPLRIITYRGILVLFLVSLLIEFLA